MLFTYNWNIIYFYFKYIVVIYFARDHTIPQLLPEENIFRLRTAWSDENGVNERDHAAYLQQFCDTFKSVLIEQIGEF